MTFSSHPPSTAIPSPPSSNHTSRWELLLFLFIASSVGRHTSSSNTRSQYFCPFVSLQNPDFPAPGQPLQHPLTRLDAEHQESALEINKLVRDVILDLAEEQMGTDNVLMPLYNKLLVGDTFLTIHGGLEKQNKLLFSGPGRDHTQPLRVAVFLGRHRAATDPWDQSESPGGGASEFGRAYRNRPTKL